MEEERNKENQLPLLSHQKEEIENSDTLVDSETEELQVQHQDETHQEEKHGRKRREGKSNKGE